MTRLAALGLGLLAGCGKPPIGDVNLLVMSSSEVTAGRSTAAVDRIAFEDCDGGDPTTVWVGYRMDLRVPDPLPIPEGNYCGVGVAFYDDAFGAPLELEGTTSTGTSFSVELDPGVAFQPFTDFLYGPLTEAVLVVDLALLFQEDDLDALDAMGTPATVRLGDALSDTLSDQVGAALRWYGSSEEAEFDNRDRYVAPDLSAGSRIRGAGCSGDRPLAYRATRKVGAQEIDGWEGPVELVDTGDTGDTGEVVPPDPSGCGQGGGCDLGGGCDPNVDAGSCEYNDPTACGTTGAVPPAALPVAWAAAVAALARRRRTAPRT